MTKFISKNWLEIIFIFFAFIFSFWLMGQTFGSDPQEGTITIAQKAYSDFAANLPLVRSFSWGQNFPPQYPLFPNEPIRYHFLFYFLVGLLEKIGLPLGWALNLPSALGFFALLLMIYFLALLLFKSRSVAILSLLFFLFNGSFGFYYFFQKHALSLSSILGTTDFSAFGPYDQGPITAFWNLNIYTNQRHFSSGLFFALLPLYLILKNQKRKRPTSLKITLLLGILVGLLPFWHATAFIMALVILAGFFCLFPQRSRTALTIATALILALPQIIFLNPQGAAGLRLHPGYLIAETLSLYEFLRFWILNLGLVFFLIPFGVFFAPKNEKKVFFLVIPIFLLGNLFQFSPDMAVNHKFFNLFLIFCDIFVTYLLVILFKKNMLAKIFIPIFVFFLILSGIIDFFAIKNDRLYTLSDFPKNPDIVWIKNNTPPAAIFLNSSYLYHPASLAGRKIFLGWPYFPWSAGYDTVKRLAAQKLLYRGQDFAKICRTLKAEKIDFIETQSSPDKEILINYAFWDKNFLLLYQNPRSHLKIYSAKEGCRPYVKP